MGNAMEFTEANFQQDVLDSDVPVLVDFWAPWCGPCKTFKPVMNEVAGEGHSVQFIDIDQQQDLAAKCNFEKSNMSRLEAGRVNPTLSTLEKVAKALEVTLVELFNFQE